MEEQDIEQELQQIKKIYDGDLDFNTIKDNPILKPIAEINETFINLELMINKALAEYEELQEEINKMVEDNPVYSETMLMSKVQNFKVLVKQIIFSQDLQKTNMIDKINEMVGIVDEEYDIRGNEEIIIKPKTTEKLEETKKAHTETPKEEQKEDVFEKLKKIAGKEEEKSSEEEKIYSSLVERKIQKEVKK